MVQAGVAPYPGAPAGYPAPPAPVGAASATDTLSMAVAAVKADPVNQLKTESGAPVGVASSNVANIAAAAASAAQLYMQQKKVCFIYPSLDFLPNLDLNPNPNLNSKFFFSIKQKTNCFKTKHLLHLALHSFSLALSLSQSLLLLSHPHSHSDCVSESLQTNLYNIN